MRIKSARNKFAAYNYRKPDMYQCADSSAFTLIEVLVSLTLLTVVLGAIYSTFFSVQTAMERFDNVSLKYHEARTALDIIRREIESALLKDPEIEDDSKVKASFVIKDRDILGNNASSLELTSFSFRGYNPNSISYFIKSGDNKLSLFKKETPPLLQSKGYTLEILENIESFSVETLFNNKWVRTWDAAETGRLPEVVRVIIEFNDNGNIIKLTEYARPRVGSLL
jgi:prepilin-type N-terminal cleavage/methylation domain-containing protein